MFHHSQMLVMGWQISILVGAKLLRFAPIRVQACAKDLSKQLIQPKKMGGGTTLPLGFHRPQLMCKLRVYYIVKLALLLGR